MIEKEKKELQGRKNAAISLLISAGGEPFKCVFWTTYLFAVVFFDIVVVVLSIIYALFFI